MKRIKLLLMIILFASASAVAQVRPRIVSGPTQVIVNIGNGLYSIELDSHMVGKKKVWYKGETTAEVELDGAGIILLNIPEIGLVFSGSYSLVSVVQIRNGKISEEISTTALVTEWESKHWSQNEFLDLLRTEMNWRAENYNANIIVDKHDVRVYQTQSAAIAMKKMGAVLTTKEFLLPSSNYSHNFEAYKGALIFDAKGDNLIMRQIDNRGRDLSFAIKKNGEVEPISPKKEFVRPRVVTPIKNLG